MGIVKQLPIILKSVSSEVDYEGDSSTRVRSVIWTLTFTVKGYLYGSVTEPKIIRTSTTNIYDENSLKTNQTLVNVANTAFGEYQFDETVFQGYSYETATATAQVKSWSSSTYKLGLKNLNGHFITGAPIVGVTTQATSTPLSFENEPFNTITLQVTPNAANVVMPNNYTYSVQVTEFPNNIP
jgi:hypothetical protein